MLQWHFNLGGHSSTYQHLEELISFLSRLHCTLYKDLISVAFHLITIYIEWREISSSTVYLNIYRVYVMWNISSVFGALKIGCVQEEMLYHYHEAIAVSAWIALWFRHNLCVFYLEFICEEFWCAPAVSKHSHLFSLVRCRLATSNILTFASQVLFWIHRYRNIDFCYLECSYSVLFWNLLFRFKQDLCCFALKICIFMYAFNVLSFFANQLFCPLNAVIVILMMAVMLLMQ